MEEAEERGTTAGMETGAVPEAVGLAALGAAEASPSAEDGGPL